VEGDNNKMKLRSKSIEVEVTLKGNEILRSNQQLFLETKGHIGNEKLVGSKLNFVLKIGIEMCF
jgi:cytochrome c